MKTDEAKVPKAVYYQCFWLVKDLDRLRRLEAVNKYTHKNDELIFFIDEEEVIRDSEVLKTAEWKLGCIREALEALPEEYRQGTIDSITYNLPFGDIAHENTWRKWRLIFIRELAGNLKLI